MGGRGRLFAGRVGEQGEADGMSEREERSDDTRAVRVGDRIEVSGTTATDEEGNLVGAGDPYDQASQAIANVERALDDAEASLQDVVRMRMFVTDIDHYEAIGRAHSDAFDDVRPATSRYEVSALVDPEMLVEIEAVAVVDD